MSNKNIKVEVIEGFYFGNEGRVIKRIPGGNFFRILFDSGKEAALHITEFRMFNDKSLKGI